MARSSSVWIVLRKEQILAAFTVKHEMMSYLEAFGVVTDVAVLQIQDGWRNRTIPRQQRLTAKELLGWG